MEISILIWGIGVTVGIVVMGLLGFFCPCISKWEKKKATSARTHRMYVPTFHVKERYSYKSMLALAASIVFLALICALVSVEFGEVLDAYPLWIDILFCIGWLIIHSLIYFVYTFVFFALARLRLEYICRVYPSKYNVDVVNRMIFKPLF